MKPEAKILWIDDMAHPETIKRDSYIIKTARNCEKGMEILEKKTADVDAIVLDVIMPQAGWESSYLYRLPGLELARAVKSNDALQHIPIAIWAWIVDDERVSLAKEIGVKTIKSKQEFSLKETLDILLGHEN